MSEKIPVSPPLVESSTHKNRLVKWLKTLLGYSLLLLLITHAVDFYRLSQHKNLHVAPALLSQLTIQLPQSQQQAFSHGEPMLVYVWGSWCGVCRTTSKAVSNIAEHHPVASIALKSGDPSQVEAYLKKKGYAFSALADEEGRWANSLQAHATPSFFIINKRGEILYYSVGINTEPSLRAKLALFYSMQK